MIKLDKVPYRSEVTATGGATGVQNRPAPSSISRSRFRRSLADWVARGGIPSNCFAAGYAACFWTQ